MLRYKHDLHLENPFGNGRFEDIQNQPAPTLEAPEANEDSGQREALISAVTEPTLSSQTKLEILASTNNTAHEAPSVATYYTAVLESYGLHESDLDPLTRQQLLAFTRGLDASTHVRSKEEIVNVIDDHLRKHIVDSAITMIDRLTARLGFKKDNPAEFESLLRDIMRRLSLLSDHFLIAEDQNAMDWIKINVRFKGLVETKRFSSEEISKIFSNVFQDYADFIDDEIVYHAKADYRGKHGHINHEDLVREVYGRTPGEMEDIKTQNRIAVVQSMQEMHQNEPYVTSEMLARLHRINNRGVVAKDISRLRERPDETVTFGGNIGVLPKDVKAEMLHFDERVSEIIDRSIIESWSDERYAIAVAQLHNDLLAIHPFLDRNGSTALLFIELMMMRRGYTPPEKREKNFKKKLHRIFGNRIIPIGIIGMNLYRMKDRLGYYKKGITSTSENIKEYEGILAILRERRTKRAARATA